MDDSSSVEKCGQSKNDTSNHERDQDIRWPFSLYNLWRNDIVCAMRDMVFSIMEISLCVY